MTTKQIDCCIKLPEDEIGFPKFERNDRGAALAPAGVSARIRSAPSSMARISAQSTQISMPGTLRNGAVSKLRQSHFQRG